MLSSRTGSGAIVSKCLQGMWFKAKALGLAQCKTADKHACKGWERGETGSSMKATCPLARPFGAKKDPGGRHDSRMSATRVGARSAS